MRCEYDRKSIYIKALQTKMMAESKLDHLCDPDEQFITPFRIIELANEVIACHLELESLDDRQLEWMVGF